MSSHSEGCKPEAASRWSQIRSPGPGMPPVGLRVALGLAAAAAIGACAPATEESRGLDAADRPEETIEEALARVTESWMRIPGVVGTGIGLCEGQPCIKVFVSRPPDELDPPIPDEVSGHPVRVEPTGPFRALDSVGGS